MKTLCVIWLIFLSCQLVNAEDPAILKLNINLADSSQSLGTLVENHKPSLVFTLSSGRKGVLCEGARFRDGYSLLGRFRINAIFSDSRFEIDPKLEKLSGKPVEYLKSNLFKNMNSIDFDGDSKTAEYGAAYFGLEPIADTAQPFRFGDFNGTFRWYSFAIHGTNDPTRIGRAATGGCINLEAKTVLELHKHLKLGQLVEITANGSYRPKGCVE